MSFSQISLSWISIPRESRGIAVKTNKPSREAVEDLERAWDSGRHPAHPASTQPVRPGHHELEAGDAVLEHFARSGREKVRTQDHLGRTVGEEFLLVLPQVRLDEAVRIIDRIRNGFPPAVLTYSGLELPCTFSAGVIEALPDDDRSSILRRADRALYAAKEEGRDCTGIGSEEAR